jgi:glycosyltransferase involved in cell wall biosynthesis
VNGRVQEEAGLSPQRRLRILFVAGCWYPHDEAPIQGIFVRRHAEAVALTNSVTVLHPYAVTEGPDLPEVLRRNWGSLREIHIRFRSRRVVAGESRGHQAGFFRSGRLGCQEILAVGDHPDVIHFHVVPSLGLVAAVKSVFPNTPMVLTEHWSGYLPESGVKLGLFRRLYTGVLTRRVRVVTTVSRRHRDAMLDLGFKGRFEIVPNVVDTEVFHPDSGVMKDQPLRFVHVSGLRAEKNVPEIIRAMGRLLRKYPNAKLNIVGDGPERRKAEAVAEELDLCGRSVFFLGMLESGDVASVLRRSDVLILLSDFENSPCVLLEAMACGLFVVAPRVGGIPEIVTPQRGILVPPGDGPALAEAMEMISRQGRNWDSRAIRTYSVRTFSQVAVQRRFDDVYAVAHGQ